MVLLHGHLDLQAFLEVVESGIFETTVANKVVKLVSCFDYVQVGHILWSNDVLFLQDADITIYVQVLQVLLPLVKAYD